MPSRLACVLAAAVLTLARPVAGATATTTVACASVGTPLQSAAIRVGDVQRSYLVHVAAHPSGERLPIVLAFHGRGESPELLDRYSGLDRLHAVMVYPRGEPGEGGKLSWSGTPTAAPDVDDVQFARAIVAGLRGWSCVDPARVYATGKSDGGGFAAQLACRAADLVRAVAPVAGAYYPNAGGCAPTRPVDVLEFHGTDDHVVPYLGSEDRGLPDVHAWLTAWAHRDDCTGEQPSQRVADDVTLSVWSGCAGDARVAGYRILGGGHTWPGALARSGPGVTTEAIDATALIARFFDIAVAR